MFKNKNITDWLDSVKNMCKPLSIEYIDGENINHLRNKALESGEIIKLNEEYYPGCFLHRSAIDDVARAEDRTFICTTNKQTAGSNNNWCDPKEMTERLEKLFDGCMSDRTMYVIPFCMGPVGSPYAKYGIEITDSIYVVLNMCIMTRVSKKVIEIIETTGEFVKCLHSKADLNKDDRYICHFPEQNTIWSINSGYGGNALLGKKCFALRIASYQAWKEKWLAEHMVILGIENPQGEIKYVCAAFPSACGKTNLAMLIPPDIYKGYKIWCVGDDISWLNIHDGRLYAINPENGYFGVVPGTNKITNPNALGLISHDTIFTNVALDKSNNTPWWEGLGNPPTNAINWKGEEWNGQTSKEPGAHPNSRFTASAKNCPILSPEFENPQGVPISAFIFGGRRAKTTPLVYEARDFTHGVFMAATMASETTTAQTGAVGVVRFDSMAMKPFCGYNMGDYFYHWLDIGKTLGENAPKIFCINWFRTDKDGKFLWPGYGENMRVLDWILQRVDNNIHANEVHIGLMPRPEDINTSGLDVSMESLLNIDRDLWKKEAAAIREYFESYGDSMPAALLNELDKLEDRICK